MTQRISVKTEYIKDLLSQIYKQHNEITSLHGLVKELREGLAAIGVTTDDLSDGRHIVTVSISTKGHTVLFSAPRGSSSTVLTLSFRDRLRALITKADKATGDE